MSYSVIQPRFNVQYLFFLPPFGRRKVLKMKRVCMCVYVYVCACVCMCMCVRGLTTELLAFMPSVPITVLL